MIWKILSGRRSKRNSLHQKHGEIYIKYAALGNNNLEKFLQKQDCEYMLPGVLNFVMYCVDTYLTDYKLYGGSFWKYGANKGAMWYLKHLESILHSASKCPILFRRQSPLVDWRIIVIGSDIWGKSWTVGSSPMTE